MAKYLLNTTMSTYLFRGGNIEIQPKKVRAVTDSDFNSGMFEAAILTGAIQAYDREEDVPLVTGTIPTPPEMERIHKPGDGGASREELAAFIKKQHQKAADEADRFKVEAEVIPSETEPVAEPAAVAPVVTESKIEEVVAKPKAAKPGRKPAEPAADSDPT